jgi:hypothetical protein
VAVSHSDPSHYFGEEIDPEGPAGPKVQLCHRRGKAGYQLIAELRQEESRLMSESCAFAQQSPFRNSAGSNQRRPIEIRANGTGTQQVAQCKNVIRLPFLKACL